MILRLGVAAAIVVVAIVVAKLIERRRPDPPTQPRWAVPVQLDRRDFAGADQPWLLAVFTSETCESCARATLKTRPLASPVVAYQEISWQDRPDLHERYSIEAAPTIVLADQEGVVRASFIGVPGTTELWAAVAEARDGPATEAREGPEFSSGR